MGWSRVDIDGLLAALAFWCSLCSPAVLLIQLCCHWDPPRFDSELTLSCKCVENTMQGKQLVILLLAMQISAAMH